MSVASGSFTSDPHLATVIRILHTQLGRVERGEAEIPVLGQSLAGCTALSKCILSEPHCLDLGKRGGLLRASSDEL